MGMKVFIQVYIDFLVVWYFYYYLINRFVMLLTELLSFVCSFIMPFNFGLG
jgi:hypothetical protein